jgi:hypothetical protein
MKPTSWQPLSARLGKRVFDDALHQGTPDYLAVPLRDWCREAFSRFDVDEAVEHTYVVQRLALRLRLPVSGAYSNEAWDDSEALLRAAREPDDLLDIVDSLLRLTNEARLADDDMIHHLNLILDEGGSAFHVGADRAGLEHRVAPTVVNAYRIAVDSSGSATEAGSADQHLAIAWAAAYGRRPDPTRAYSEAIKAVEAATHAVVQPHQSRATLGTILGEIKNARHKFTITIPTPGHDPIAPVEAMMRMLWEGQTSRHGGQTPTRVETLEAARMAVHLAVTLVQWFAVGAVSRQP